MSDIIPVAAVVYLIFGILLADVAVQEYRYRPRKPVAFLCALVMALMCFFIGICALLASTSWLFQ